MHGMSRRSCPGENFPMQVNILEFVTLEKLNFHETVIFPNRFCAEKWDGSSLVMGTMYSYDIFAAMPCCTERLKVSHIYVYHHNVLYTFLSKTETETSLKVDRISMFFS